MNVWVVLLLSIVIKVVFVLIPGFLLNRAWHMFKYTQMQEKANFIEYPYACEVYIQSTTFGVYIMTIFAYL